MRETMLVIHFLGLGMGIGTSFGMMFLGIAAAKLPENERLKFQMNAFSLSKMGHVGLVLLILSGGYLMTPYWSTLADQPLLIAKLSFVLLLAAVIGILSARARRAVKAQDLSSMDKMRPLGQLALITSLVIVVLAVMVFR